MFELYRQGRRDEADARMGHPDYKASVLVGIFAGARAQQDGRIEVLSKSFCSGKISRGVGGDGARQGPAGRSRRRRRIGLRIDRQPGEWLWSGSR